MKFVDFENGLKMPIIGLGMWQTTDPTELEIAVTEALNAGYRHFDTAYMYQNEEVFGKVLKKWFDAGNKREELFIVTKLPMTGMHHDRVQHFLNLSLKDLQLEYADLYLIHVPIGIEYVSDTELFPVKDGKLRVDRSTDLEAIWTAMEKQVDAGRAKSIGISNFNVPQIERIMKIARIHPQNIQVEMNVYFQQKQLREVCKKHKISICAYAPFGSPGRKALYEQRGMELERIPAILDDPLIVQLARKHNKTAGQILLRFLVQLNVVTIPKSVNPERLKQNLEIFGFELSPDDMFLLEGLDKGEAGRSFTLDFFPGLADHPEIPY